jgi:hypothetical protein
MSRYLFIAAVLALGMLMSYHAQARCVWTWDCSRGTGQCRRIPICDNAMEMAPPPVPEVAPVVPPGIPPIGVPTVAPPGTRSCAPARLCNRYGQCQWRTVCS